MAFGRKKDERLELDITPGGAPAADGGETFLDAGSELIGELRFSQNVRLDGRIEGQVIARKGVLVGEQAEIDASIEAERIEIYGTVTGDIRVARKTILHKSARVEGEIHTAGIVVEEGARFKGCIIIGPDEGTTPTMSSSDVPSLAAVRDEPRPAREPES